MVMDSIIDKNVKYLIGLNVRKISNYAKNGI
jgi:hypothetical protein